MLICFLNPWSLIFNPSKKETCNSTNNHNLKFVESNNSSIKDELRYKYYMDGADNSHR